MDIAKDEYITGKNRVQAAVDNMALSFLEIKPKFVDRAREMFECECQFYLDDPAARRVAGTPEAPCSEPPHAGGHQSG